MNTNSTNSISQTPTRLDPASIAGDESVERSNNAAQHAEPLGSTSSGVSVRVVTPERAVRSGYTTPPPTIRPPDRPCTPVQEERRRRLQDEQAEQNEAPNRVRNVKRKIGPQGEGIVHGPEPKFDPDKDFGGPPPPPPPPAVQVF